MFIFSNENIENCLFKKKNVSSHFQTRPILHARQIPSNRAIRSPSAHMENALLHMHSNHGFGHFVGGQVQFSFVGLSICVDYVGAAAAAYDTIFLRARTGCGEFENYLLIFAASRRFQ